MKGIPQILRVFHSYHSLQVFDSKKNFGVKYDQLHTNGCGGPIGEVGAGHMSFAAVVQLCSDFSLVRHLRGR